jgi:hypothetical protein
MSKSKRIVAPFINDFGQVIQPNEEVFAVTTCTHRTQVFEAKYVGYVERESYNWKENKYETMKFAQISTPSTRHVYYKKGTTELFQWGSYVNGMPGDQQYDRVEEPFNQISTLQYNRILSKNSSLHELASVV